MPSFKVGDFVRNKNSGYYWVIDGSTWYDTVPIRPVPEKYNLKTGKGRTEACVYNLEAVSKAELDKIIFEKELDKMEKLYEFTYEGKKLFGYKLAVNSEGLWVMDVKGGAPVAINATDAQEVIPYSVKVRNFLTKETSHVMVDKDKLEVDSIYCDKNGIYIVLELDTKTKTPLYFNPVSRFSTKSM